MKVKVPGLAESTGVKPVDFSLPKGDYAFEIGEVTIKESENSPCIIHTFPMIVLDGPDDEKTGKTTQGRKWYRRVIQLLPEHDSYREADTRAADELADLCSAAGVECDEDGYETEDFAGTRVRARLSVRMGKDQDGNPQPENSIMQQKDDEGHVHMYLSDDDKPVSRAATTKKASGSSRSRSVAATRRR